MQKFSYNLYNEATLNEKIFGPSQKFYDSFKKIDWPKTGAGSTAATPPFSFYAYYLIYSGLSKYLSNQEKKIYFKSCTKNFEDGNIWFCLIEYDKPKFFHLGDYSSLLCIDLLLPFESGSPKFLKGDHINRLCKEINFKDFSDTVDQKVAFHLEKNLYAVAKEAMKCAEKADHKIIKGSDIREAYENVRTSFLSSWG